jgi:hypothetical protein
MMKIDVDATSMLKLEEATARAGKNAPLAIRRALNWTGERAATQVTRTLAKQTGTKYGTVKAALVRIPAGFARLTYTIRAAGGFLSLKEFSPRQTAKGVSAAPWGKRHVFPHAFILSKLGGHVFVRTSSKRFPLKKLWGPALPAEMVKSASKQVFEDTVARVLPARVDHELSALITGIAPH